MKNIKKFEIYKDSDSMIETIIKPWTKKLMLEGLVLHYESKTAYLKSYQVLSSDSHNDFMELFKLLDKLRIRFRFTDEDTLFLDYHNIDINEYELYVSTKKYNL